MIDQTVDLAALWGRNGAVLRERVFEAGDDEARLDVLESVLIEQACRGFIRDAGFDLAYRLQQPADCIQSGRTRSPAGESTPST
jgi:hypothetical protein